MNYRITAVLFGVVFLIIIFINDDGRALSKADRQCIQREWRQNPTIKETTDHGSSFFIAFGDVQKRMEWLHLPEIVTSEKSEILMLVQSRSENLGRRNVLRRTWMEKNNTQMMREGRMKALFLVGIVEKDENNKKILLEEAKLYGDLIVVDLIDNYVGLTYKTIASFLYATSKAPKFQLIGKIDEDVAFFPDRLINLLYNDVIDTNTSTLYGEIVRAGGEVNHDKSKRWHVTEKAYKCKKYPECLSGPFYLATRKAALDILSDTKHRNFISIEDVFITGLLADDVGVARKSLPMLHMLPEDKTVEEKTEMLAWHTSKNNDQYMEFFTKNSRTR
ncbi:hypothetical protein CRE_14828 [Caenorhabditis remanei]|uniref:Hexosyltransferase n=1 Tax=Caenorhabditis remanei TaxID=31234 RepID=E3N1V2_CAERE|nr:hypothetical protein CRE_14828 [Caenorhabditis remanei]